MKFFGKKKVELSADKQAFKAAIKYELVLHRNYKNHAVMALMRAKDRHDSAEKYKRDADLWMSIYNISHTEYSEVGKARERISWYDENIERITENLKKAQMDESRHRSNYESVKMYYAAQKMMDFELNIPKPTIR